MEELGHDEIRDALYKYLQKFIDEHCGRHNANLNKEKWMATPTGNGVADLQFTWDEIEESAKKVYTDRGYDIDGVVFEVKSQPGNDTIVNTIGQLQKYPWNNHVPCLVAPGHFIMSKKDVQAVRDSEAKTLYNIIRECDIPIIEVVSADPIRFTPYDAKSQYPIKHLDGFLMRTTLNTSGDTVYEEEEAESEE
jgi:hypothetical protein